MPPQTKKPARAVPTSLSALRTNMTKTYGEGRVSARARVEPYQVIPTGSMSLDLALRVGGWALGRIHEVVGPEGVGKTTLCINSAAGAQKRYQDKAVGYIDMEQTFDWDWAERNGLDTSDERFLHVYPDHAEDVSDQVKAMIETGLFSLIIVDSIGGMESKQAFEKQAEEHVMGRNAQVITRMVKRLASEARKHQVAVLLVNQYRANLANPQGMDQSAGPKALKYATTTKVEMRRTSTDALKYDFKDGEGLVVVGVENKARVTRNKIAAANKSGTFWIINQDTPEWGPVGIDQAAEAYAIGTYTEVIDAQPGGYHWMPWTTDKKERIHGKAAVMAFLRANPERAEEVRQAAVAKMSQDVIPQHLVDFDEAEPGEKVDVTTGEVVEA